MGKDKITKELDLCGEVTDFLIYNSPSGKIKVDVFLHDETIWLTLNKISELFGVVKSTISEHIKNIFKNNELTQNATVRKFRTVQKEGNRHVSREIEYYNLDVIISVGYRVNSTKATHFRIWATRTLQEYIIKGFVMDDERLKNPNHTIGKDYFDEQLARIRNIRSSERRFYQKITDIYAECSTDYNLDSEITKEFFAIVQNKLHWAISGNTAAEIVYKRVNSTKKNMGLTSWKNAPKGKIRKHDVIIAKNYLNKKELDTLNRIVTMYLDYAELQAKTHKLMYMSDWINRLNAFLEFNEQNILDNAGEISQKMAKEFAESEFEKFENSQNELFESDFDKLIKKTDYIVNSNKKIKKLK